MLTERLQVLVSPEQRRRLEAAARRSQRSIGAVIRDAVDAHLDAAERSGRRHEAVEAILALREANRRRGLVSPEPEALRALIDDREDWDLPGAVSTAGSTVDATGADGG